MNKANIVPIQMNQQNICWHDDSFILCFFSNDADDDDKEPKGIVCRPKNLFFDINFPISFIFNFDFFIL